MTGANKIEVDSKAMRKFNADESIYGAIEVIEVGTATMQFAFCSRMLVKNMS